MSDLDLLLAVAGGIVTVLVVVGMILITPRGQVTENAETSASRVDGASDPASTPMSGDRDSSPHPPVAPIHEREAAVDGVTRPR